MEKRMMRDGKDLLYPDPPEHEYTHDRRYIRRGYELKRLLGRYPTKEELDGLYLELLLDISQYEEGVLHQHTITYRKDEL